MPRYIGNMAMRPAGEPSYSCCGRSGQEYRGTHYLVDPISRPVTLATNVDLRIDLFGPGEYGPVVVATFWSCDVLPSLCLFPNQ